MKLAAVLACRNQSSRLYAKPIQRLDVEQGVTILDFLVDQLKTSKAISDIVLAISDRVENQIYQEIASDKGLPFILGNDEDVLARLIKGAKKVDASHIFRVTTESPFCHLDELTDIFDYHCKHNIDYSYLSGPPDGAYYEIIKLEALKKSWEEGETRHRSELCTLYIYENKDKFKIKQHKAPEKFCASDVRLTVDWPEDLIVMRAIYERLGMQSSTRVSISEIIKYLRAHPKINMINNWIDSGIGRVWY